MIPIKDHIKSLQKFENEFKKLTAKIDEIEKKNPEKKFNEEEYKLLMRFMDFIRFWENIDDFIEDKVEPFLNKTDGE